MGSPRTRPVALLYGTLLAGHAMAETARDALYLANHDASRLPAVYLGLAGSGAVVSLVLQRRAGDAPARRLVAILATGALAMLVFGLVASRAASGWGTALYLWTGLFGMVSTSAIWAWIAGRSDLRRAQAEFTRIGATGIAGAIIGSLLAVGLSRIASSQAILGAAAIVLAVAAAGVAWVGGDDPVAAPHTDLPPTNRLASAQRRYVLLLAAFVLASGVTLTAADLLFKATVARSVPAEGLAQAFGITAAVTDALALVVQTVVTPWVLRRFGLAAAMSALPIALSAALTAGVAGAVVPAAFALRSLAGGLQHSLHGTALELLHMPFDLRLRRRLAATLQPVAYRLGQGLAAVLATFALAASEPRATYLLVLVLAVLWVALAMLAHRSYLGLFRARLGAFEPDPRVPLPTHALSTVELEMVLRSLTPDETDCLAALRMLDRHGRCDLVPSVMLSHPAPEVVLAALELLVRARPPRLGEWLARCLEHRNATVRGRAAAALLAIDGDLDVVAMLDDVAPPVRTVARVLAIGRDIGRAEEHLGALRRSVANEGGQVREALVRAWMHSPPNPELDALVLEVAQRDAPLLADALIDAVAVRPEPCVVEALACSLTTRRTRDAVHAALHRLGAPALGVLVALATRDDTPRALRLRLPDAIAALLDPASGEALHDWLRREDDGSVRYNVLRALSRFVHDGGTLPEGRELGSTASSLIRRTTVRWVKLAWWREQLTASVGATALVEDERVSLLDALLLDKQRAAMERLFRLLGLVGLRGEDPEVLFDALRSGRERDRESALELLSHALDDPSRQAILALLSDHTLRRRIGQAAGALGVVLTEGGLFWAELERDGSTMVREVARVAREASSSSPAWEAAP
jgi:AAA family ATP:ADP antiporter